MTTAKLGQFSFTGGIFSDILDGQTDFAKYSTSLKRLENFIVWPHGPVSFRPGFKFVAETKDSSLLSSLIPFEFSVTQAYIIEVGDEYFRFYKDKEQILSVSSAYEISSGYDNADVAKIKYTQSADVLYLFHRYYASTKLSRTSHTSWTSQEINWNPGPMSEQAVYPSATLTLAALTGTGITFTAGSGVFRDGDVGRLIVSGAGRASIVSYTGTDEVDCDIIDDFPVLSSIGGYGAVDGDYGIVAAAHDLIDIGYILSAGNVESFKIYVREAGTARLKVWRANGSDYDFVGQSQAESVSPGLNEVTIDTPFAVNSGDFIGIHSSAGLEETTALNAGYDLVYAVGDETTTIEAGDLTTIDDFSLCIEVFQSAVGPISSGNWHMLGSPNGSLTPDVVGPVGAICTLTSATNLFRQTDAGKFIRINSGVVKITTYTTATSVKGEVLKELSSTDASTSWTLESLLWNETNGYPSCGTFYGDRLMVAGSNGNPETVWGSVVGDYENHTPGIDDADAVQFSIQGRKVNVIRWIEPREHLLIGTVGSEWRLGPEDTGEPLTPLNVVAKQITTKGCADILPITVDGSTLFVQRQQRKIRELAYDYEKGENGGYTAPDLTLLAKELTEGGVVSWTYQQEPFQTLWLAVSGGNLIGLTYLREQQVVAWHEHPMDNGEVESLATIPGDGYDEVWAIIKRTIDGSTVRYVEVMEKVFEDSADTYDSNSGLNAFFVDSGITYNSTETSTITGLDHLEGETVAILADGVVQDSKTVSSGQITLDTAASLVHVGLPYTGTIKTQRLDFQANDGTIQSRRKRIVELFVRVLNSGEFKAGRDESNLDTIQDPDLSLVSGEPYPLFSGDLRTNFEDDYDRDTQLYIVQDKPMPLTVLAIYPEVELGDD